MSHDRLSMQLLSFRDFSVPQPILLHKQDAFSAKSLKLSDLERVKARSHTKTQMLWFYADWCGHCHAMKDEWQKATVIGHDVAEWHVVDCANEGAALARRLDVTSFPTIKSCAKGVLQQYTGRRTSGDFISFART